MPVLVGAVEARPVVIGGAVTARPMLTITATFDHRYVDARHAVRFADAILRYRADPGAYDPTADREREEAKLVSDREKVYRAGREARAGYVQRMARGSYPGSDAATRLVNAAVYRYEHEKQDEETKPEHSESTLNVPTTKTPPRTRLITGPAAATSAPARGVDGSSSNVAMPPSAHSVMSLTHTPKPRASRACDS